MYPLKADVDLLNLSMPPFYLNTSMYCCLSMPQLRNIRKEAEDKREWGKHFHSSLGAEKLEKSLINEYCFSLDCTFSGLELLLLQDEHCSISR